MAGRALSDSKEFGRWFGVKLTDAFHPGAHVRGTIAPTAVDEAVARAQEPYAGAPFEIRSTGWSPSGSSRSVGIRMPSERDVDYSAEPSTLVVFELREVPEGTWVTVVESGFDGIPLARRATAFTANERGWTMVVELIGKHVARA